MPKQKSIQEWSGKLFDATWPMGSKTLWYEFIDAVIAEHERRKRSKRKGKK